MNSLTLLIIENHSSQSDLNFKFSPSIKNSNLPIFQSLAQNNIYTFNFRNPTSILKTPNSQTNPNSSASIDLPNSRYLNLLKSSKISKSTIVNQAIKISKKFQKKISLKFQPARSSKSNHNFIQSTSWYA